MNKQKSGSLVRRKAVLYGGFKWHYNFETGVLLLSAYGETREKTRGNFMLGLLE